MGYSEKNITEGNNHVGRGVGILNLMRMEIFALIAQMLYSTTVKYESCDSWFM